MHFLADLMGFGFFLLVCFLVIFFFVFGFVFLSLPGSYLGLQTPYIDIITRDCILGKDLG